MLSEMFFVVVFFNNQLYKQELYRDQIILGVNIQKNEISSFIYYQ